MTVGIVGAGVAGLELARGIRRNIKHMDVVLYNKSKYTTLQALYPEYVTRHIYGHEIEINVDAYCDAYGIEFDRHYVSSVDTEFGGATITCDESRTCKRKTPHWRAVIASGLEQTLNDLDDDYEFEFGDFHSMQRLRSATDDIGSSSNVVIIGAGSTGIELACLMRERFRCKTFLLEAENRILPSYHQNVSKIVSCILDKKNIRVFCGEKVENVDKYVVHTRNHHLKTDMVIWTVGMRASRLARSLNFSKRNGFLAVNPQFRVNSHIFAVGDNAWIENNGKIATKNALEAERQAKFLVKVIEDDLYLRKSNRKYKISSSDECQKALLTVGNKKAIGIWGSHVLHHCQERVYKYKNKLDRGFIKRYRL